MIKINSQLTDNKQSLDVHIEGMPVDVLPEFGSIIKTICADFIRNVSEPENRKEFAMRLAMMYSEEIYSAYRDVISGDNT